MTIDPAQLGVGALLAALVAAGGFLTASLSAGGALAALAVGTAVFGLGGPFWGLVLVFFFVSSSALSAWRAGAKADAAGRAAKGARRDAGQVLANGGVGALLAVLQPLVPGVDLLPAFVGAMAAVTADTWATEIGLLSADPPRLVTTGEIVPPGMSGGVTVLGSAAAALGGVAIGIVAFALVATRDLVAFRSLDPRWLDLSAARLLVLAPVAGVASSTVDSWLGATAQAVYRCADCGEVSERRDCACGGRTTRVRGRPWMTNDAVNALASGAGALVGALVAAVFAA